MSPSRLFEKYGTASYEKSFAVLNNPLFFPHNDFIQSPERTGALLLVRGCASMDGVTDSTRFRISEIRGWESLSLSTRPWRSESVKKFLASVNNRTITIKLRNHHHDRLSRHPTQTSFQRLALSSSKPTPPLRSFIGRHKENSLRRSCCNWRIIHLMLP